MQSGKVSCGPMNQNLKFFLEIMEAMSSGLKRRGTIWLVISAQFKNQHLWWYGGISAHACMMCTTVKAPLLLNDIYRFWSNICWAECCDRGYRSGIRKGNGQWQKALAAYWFCGQNLKPKACHQCTNTKASGGLLAWRRYSKFSRLRYANPTQYCPSTLSPNSAMKPFRLTWLFYLHLHFKSKCFAFTYL